MYAGANLSHSRRKIRGDGASFAYLAGELVGQREARRAERDAHGGETAAEDEL